MPERMVTQVGERRLTVSHLDKPLWPEFSKAQVLDYYLRVADVLLPHLRDRPASFLRTPDGPEGPRFFTHSAPPGLPKWIRTVPKGHREHVAVDDTETLIAVANAYCVEIHVPQWSAATGPDLHDQIVFDLDPGEGADIATCCEVALLLRGLLTADGFACFPTTTGGVGLHLYIALDPPWLVEDALAYAKSLAQRLSADHRRLITHVRGPKARAGGKVLVDWAQNHSRATTSVPYTLRAREGAPAVATPLAWPEVEHADAGRLDFTPAEVLERIEKLGDLTIPE
ncbi:non-homologous end-joining DNA ligase [Actinospica durhamensis]|uniref:Non-homologous end-joining DNA ligase n=1 Tax=Actinospica durhamensis TaxID=1508375 RepID=A0A941EZG2_9ACTN|nr:non-homologous end-joining DNA ligase [Actinospica durhamensis]MBR7838059.1 non-homologous end-joining DNA ligase [Actinospica durhamensis]